MAAQATFALQGTLTAGDVVELSWLDEHYFHTVTTDDTEGDVLADLALNINAFSATASATHSAAASTITLTNLQPGEEGNRLGMLGTVSGFQTESWSPADQTMSGGASPTQWQVDVDFATIQDVGGASIPTQNIRKMRWTYAAALQTGAYDRSEFDVEITDWIVTGTNRPYSAVAPRSRRFQGSDEITLVGTWSNNSRNFFDGSIDLTSTLNDQASFTYTSQVNHRLLLGTRRTSNAGIVSVSVDGQTAQVFDLYLPSEDVLSRLDLGVLGPGAHTVVATLAGANASSSGSTFYLDFFEEAIESPTVDSQPARLRETLATDWDTDHSLALAPERVAWNLDMLGFRGRTNHFVGAVLFYELTNSDNQYAQGTVTFEGTPVFSENVQVIVDGTTFDRLTLSTDSNDSIATAFQYLIDGSTGVWASASGNVLTIYAHLLGTAGNSITLSASPTLDAFQAVASGATFSGGVDGSWLTDTATLPRLNRAARDWHRSYFKELKNRSIEVTASFSMELSHGDTSAAAGLAQRYPDGTPVLLNTPSTQTNFSTASLDFWKQVYLEMAQLQDEALITPYLQFGEVQWWYFPNAFGMTFYDDYTKTEFQNQYGVEIHVFTSNNDSPTPYPNESAFLPGLIGSFTSAIRNFVLASYPATKFEVLYPHDVNDYALTRVVNYPDTDWTTTNLDGLKTENFIYTANRNLNKALESIQFPLSKGFARSQSSHLIGVSGASQPWNWERRLAKSEDAESIVLWAFDQFSLIGYKLPLDEGKWGIHLTQVTPRCSMWLRGGLPARFALSSTSRFRSPKKPVATICSPCAGRTDSAVRAAGMSGRLAGTQSVVRAAPAAARSQTSVTALARSNFKTHASRCGSGSGRCGTSSRRRTGSARWVCSAFWDWAVTKLAST